MTRRGFFSTLLAPLVACVYTSQPQALRASLTIFAAPPFEWKPDTRVSLTGITDEGKTFLAAQDTRGRWWTSHDGGPWKEDMSYAASWWPKRPSYRQPSATVSATTLDPAYAASIGSPDSSMGLRKASTP